MFKESYKKITSSDLFKDFASKNPDLELCAVFFITDYFGNDNKKTLDYKLGDKIFSFSLDEHDSIKMKEDKLVQETDERKFPVLQKVEPNLESDPDLDEIEGIAKTRTLDEGIHAKFSKIISVLQKYEGRQVWNLTCMLEGLIIIHIIIDSTTGEVVKFERKSMMDLIRKK
ncbi:MAG: hypothetical protein WC867_05390 [Candidatus Pacearchaeota archaeon]|jgi:hypothetical protein